MVGLPRQGATPPERIRARPYRCLADDPESRLTFRQANQARSDFAEILDEQDFAKAQLQPDRAWLGRTLLLGFGSTAMFGPLPMWPTTRFRPSSEDLRRLLGYGLPQPPVGPRHSEYGYSSAPQSPYLR